MSKHPLEQFTALHNQLRNPPPARAIAIAACAYLEDALGDILREALVGLNTRKMAKVFEGDGFLNPISHKLDLALGLGFFRVETYNQFVTIARIRNRFAHKLEVISFDHTEVADLVDSLRLPEDVLKSATFG